MNDGDVGVVQCSGGAGFLLETSQALRVGCVLFRRHFDRHLAAAGPYAGRELRIGERD